MTAAEHTDVVCFGEILWDLFDVGVLGTFRRELGGAPANVATGLARLGVRAALVGGVGEDRFGDALVRHLENDGVDTRFIVRLPNRTGITFVTRDAKGEPSFLFYRHETADVALTRAHITKAMGRAKWVLVGTSTLMNPALAGATARFIEVASQQGASLVVDLNVRPHMWPRREEMRSAIARLVRDARLVKASAADLAALGDGGASGLGWLAKHAPDATWLVTRGPRTASAVGPHGEVSLAAKRSRSVDATGAGDAFLAGALAVLLAARATPGSAAWMDPLVWRSALAIGHRMARKAIAEVGSVRGLVRLARIQAAIARVSVASRDLRTRK